MSQWTLYLAAQQGQLSHGFGLLLLFFLKFPTTIWQLFEKSCILASKGFTCETVLTIIPVCTE